MDPNLDPGFAKDVGQQLPTEPGVHEPVLKLEMSLRPATDVIIAARRLVVAACTPVLGDTDASWRVGVATHELLENAAKYSVDDRARFELSVVPVASGHAVAIRLTNEAAGAEMRVLASAIAEIHAATDGATYYKSLLERNRMKQQGSGLGLARIFAEAEMVLALDVEGSTVCLTATALLP